MSEEEKIRFKLILDYPDEIGISDNISGDITVQKVPQNNNTIGFCNSLVNMLNFQNTLINKLGEENIQLKKLLQEEKENHNKFLKEILS